MNEIARTSEAKTKLYGDDEQVADMARAVKKVAPWANDPKAPMNDHEIGLAVRRSLAMGLDPLNSHEVQIWKDKRGNVNFQIAYTLLTEWVRRFRGEHTDPNYHRLSDEELIEEGLNPNDVAYRVSFLMNEDIDRLYKLIEAGYDPPQARKMLEKHGLGVASAAEWGNKYFAPAARSKAWKVKKRALTDAYRRAFGTPNRPEIEELRRIGALSSAEELRIESDDPRDTALPAEPKTRGASKLFKTEEAQAAHEDNDHEPESDVIEGEYTEDEPDFDPEADAEAVQRVAEADRAEAAEQSEVATLLAKAKHTERPWPPEILRAVIEDKVDRFREDGWAYPNAETRENKRTSVRLNLDRMLNDDSAARHAVSHYLTGEQSSKDWDGVQVEVLRQWIKMSQGSDGNWYPSEAATREAHAIAARAHRDAGQSELPF